MSACNNVKRNIFVDLSFELHKNERKYTALCLFCGKTLANIATERLKAHRNRCKKKSNEDNNKNDMNMSCTTDLDSTVDISLMDVSQNEDCEIILISDLPTTSSTTLVTYTSSITPTTYTPSAISTTSSSLSSVSAISSSSASTSPPSNFKKPKPKKNGGLDNFLDKTSKKDEEEINELVARFFFGCNIPLNVIESKYFKDLLQKLRPAYSKVLPSRKTLSTTLLDKEYERQIVKASNQIGLHSVLLIDGWKNTASNSKLVVTMLHNAGGEKAFLNAWDLSSESETSEKLSEIIDESIDLAKKMYGTEVYAVVSDNAANMIRMGKIVNIWHNNCSAHVANLLAKNIVDKDTAEKVTKILKEFRHPDLEKIIIEKGGTKIKIPAETRWCSMRDCFLCLKNNVKFMRQLVADSSRKVKNDIRNLLFDEMLFERVEEEIALLDPVCALLNKVQSSNCCVAEAVNYWLSLNEPNSLKKIFCDRKDQALNVYALSAYFLNPFYDREKLSTKQTNSVTSFLFEELTGEGLRELDVFLNRKDYFNVLLSKDLGNDAGLFWRMASLKYPSLSSLACKLINIPASSAQIERVFSNWSYIHSDIRNRLTFERSKKLIHIYYSLKMNNIPCDDD